MVAVVIAVGMVVGVVVIVAVMSSGQGIVEAMVTTVLVISDRSGHCVYCI